MTIKVSSAIFWFYCILFFFTLVIVLDNKLGSYYSAYTSQVIDTIWLHRILYPIYSISYYLGPLILLLFFGFFAFFLLKRSIKVSHKLILFLSVSCFALCLNLSSIKYSGFFIEFFPFVIPVVLGLLLVKILLQWSKLYQAALQFNQPNMLSTKQIPINIAEKVESALPIVLTPKPARVINPSHKNETKIDEVIHNGTFDVGHLAAASLLMDHDLRMGEILEKLTVANQANAVPSNEYFQSVAKSLEEKLAEFKVNSKVVNVLKGPVVDTFELELGFGVKISRVTSMTEDLSLALQGVPIRVVYPMEGKSTLGVEVPRLPREIIYLSEILLGHYFKENKARIPIVLGKNTFGNPTIVDLVKMPHMLVAGATGAGKSVFINSFLVSMLTKLAPRQLRLILIDPKQLELAPYSKIEHLLVPVITDPGRASAALLWACEEMERRYKILSDSGVRNLESFNEKVQEFDQIPYIVIIIDEFADLILSKSGKEIENSVCRIAAKARASGIHLVLATQRPSVDVVTGLIKSNFPSRISFRVSSSTDSRTILNCSGAERLLGMGDFLFKNGVDLQRLHSAYINEEEIEELMTILAGPGEHFSEEALEFIESSATQQQSGQTSGQGLGNPGGEDELYYQAVEIVKEIRAASASMLQRRLKIGYNRAANLVELMESKGIVGPQDGARPRKVLI